MSNAEVVYFEVNNWFSGRDYPDCEPFFTWLGDDDKIPFWNEEWVKENRLVVFAQFVDMSQNFCVTAPKDWVERNCPMLFDEYSKFLREPDAEGDVYGQFDSKFLEYTEDNIGITQGEWL